MCYGIEGICMICACCLKKCKDITHLLYDSTSYISDEISNIIKDNPLGSFDLDTGYNKLGMNWSSLSTTERSEIQLICKKKIYDALKNIETNLENSILQEFTDRDINKLISFIGHQLSYNLKSSLLNYYKQSNDITKYKYTNIVKTETDYLGKTKPIRLPSNNLFKCDYTEDFLSKFLILKNFETQEIKTYFRVTKSKAEYEILHDKYLNLVKDIYRDNNDYKQIILDSFKYFDNEKKLYEEELKENNKFKPLTI